MNLSIADGWLVPLFGRIDIALVYLATALPLVIMTIAMPPRRRRLGLATLFAVTAVGSLLVLRTLADSQRELPIWLLRSVVAIGLAGLMMVLLGRSSGMSKSPRSRWLRLVIGLVVATAPPAVYVAAVSVSLGDRVEELLGQSRLGEAATVAGTLAEIDPSARVASRSIAELNETLQRDVARLRSRLTDTVPESAPAGLRVETARGWAMLGETDRAIDLIAPLVQSSAPDPAACNLLGTIGQNREQWEESRFWFAIGERRWASLDTSEAHDGQLAALLGIAYAERKLGRPREAEGTYGRAVALAPAASTHFLAAQFYADTQRAGDAARHIQQAISLDPAYRDRAALLTDRLMTHEFGCLPVYLDSRRNSSMAATLDR